MALIKAYETRACDADCGVQTRVDRDAEGFLKRQGWLFLTWELEGVSRRLELCPNCATKLGSHEVIGRALHNTSRGRKFGPDADCG